jgi:hypothetical protein
MDPPHGCLPLVGPSSNPMPPWAMGITSLPRQIGAENLIAHFRDPDVGSSSPKDVMKISGPCKTRGDHLFAACRLSRSLMFTPGRGCVKLAAATPWERPIRRASISVGSAGPP